MRVLLVVQDPAVLADLAAARSALGPNPFGTAEVIHRAGLADALVELGESANAPPDLVVLDLGSAGHRSATAVEDALVQVRALAVTGVAVLVLVDATESSAALPGDGDDNLTAAVLDHGAHEVVVKGLGYPELVGHAAVAAIHRRGLDRHRRELGADGVARDREDVVLTRLAADLRGPLDTLATGLDRFAVVAAAALDDAARADLDGLVGQVYALTRMVDDSLALDRLDSGAQAPRARFFDLHYAVVSAFATVRGLAGHKQVALINEVPTGTRVCADPMLFGQVLRTALANAVTLSYAGGEVRVYHPDERPHTLTVEDHGVGLPEPDQRAVTDHIGRGPSSGDDAGDIGYGLGLAARIMAMLGGSLEVDSRLGGGTRLHIGLPIMTPRVVVIDDDTLSRSVLSMYLRAVGAEATVIAGGREALETMQVTTPPDLVIADVFMPDMDGFTLLEEMRRDPRLAGVPVIIVTGDERVGTRERAIGLGAADFIVKPLAVQDFLPRVRRIIG